MYLSPSSANINHGDHIAFQACDVPAGTASYWWHCSDASQIISSDGAWGAITGVNNSGSTIMVQLSCDVYDAAGNHLTYTYANIYINPAPPPDIKVTSIAISPNPINLKAGEGSYIYATVYPSNATNQTLSWTTTQGSGASFLFGETSSPAYLIANAVGSGYVYCYAQDGSGIVGVAQLTVVPANPRPNNFDWTYPKSSGGSIYNAFVSGNTMIFDIMPASEWNGFLSKINEFRRYKGLDNYSFSSVNSGSACTPEVLNEAVNAINQMGYSIPQFSAGNVPATIFNIMRDTLNSIS